MTVTTYFFERIYCFFFGHKWCTCRECDPGVFCKRCHGGRGFGVSALALLFLACAATAQADPLRLAPYVVLGVGQAADVWSTRVAVSRGCTEGNAMYRSPTPTTARLVGTKLLLVGPVALTAALLDRYGHHRAAAVIATSGGVVGGAIAIWNLSIPCGR